MIQIYDISNIYIYVQYYNQFTLYTTSFCFTYMYMLSDFAWTCYTVYLIIEPDLFFVYIVHNVTKIGQTCIQ